jgi:hypothetical protein
MWRVGRAAVAALCLAGMAWLEGAHAQSLPTAADAARVAGSGERGTAVAPAVRPTALEIVERMLEKNQERTAALDRYESQRTYRVEYSGTGGQHKAEMQVRAEYVSPGQKHFTVISESGSKFICDKVLRKLVEGEQEAATQSNRMQTSLNPENYSVELLGAETIATAAGPVPSWILAVAPKADNKFTYRGRVWISQDDFAVVRIQGQPAKNPSWWISQASFESDYLRRGEVWLPAKNVSSSHVRIGGEAKLTIDYGSYPVVVTRAEMAAKEHGAALDR